MAMHGVLFYVHSCAIFDLYSRDGSMEKWYIYLHEWFISMVNVRYIYNTHGMIWVFVLPS